MSARRARIEPTRLRSRLIARKSVAAQLTLLLDAVESERANLSCAQSILECLKAAMEYTEVDSKGPYYPDLVQIVASMVRKSINALDSINLPKPRGDKVKEDFLVSEAHLLPMAHAEVALSLPPVFTPPRRFALRLHRRNYSRALTRASEREDSAAAKTPGCVAR